VHKLKQLILKPGLWAVYAIQPGKDRAYSSWSPNGHTDRVYGMISFAKNAYVGLRQFCLGLSGQLSGFVKKITR